MFTIRMADINICIHNKYSYVENMCRDYMMADDCQIDFHIEVSAEEIGREQAQADIPCSPDYCESICIYRAISNQLIRYHALLMHGACLEYHGNAYVFCAKSGTGKTTHLRLWKKVFGSDVHIINGDKPILRARNNRFYVYGTPWCGKEGWNINTSAPLSALCFLERSETNTIDTVPAPQVMERLAHQILMPKEQGELIRYLDLMNLLISETPCHLLRCNMEDEAARVAFAGLTKERNPL